jgi:very-short-patch-repair endonuclease
MLGYQFARQKPIDRYIVDFYCPKLCLVVEIDGDSHRNEFHQDVERQCRVEAAGFIFLRFHDRDVSDMPNVLEQFKIGLNNNTVRQPPSPLF